jgi:hypothetical protein
MTRTESPSQLQKGENKERPLSEIRADMAREKNIETFLGKSGSLAETSDEFQVTRSGLGAIQDYGIDISPILDVFDTVEVMSPDKRRLSRKEALQLLAPAPIIIPGVGTLPAVPKEVIGRFEHAKRMVFGEPAGGK